MNDRKLAVVVGVGPGLGGAIARRFARGGFTVALVARKAESCAPIEKQIADAGGTAKSFAIDATSPESIDTGWTAIRSAFGDADVVASNVGAFVPGAVLDLTPEAFESAWRGNCLAAFLFARVAAPAMVARGHGTLLFTGATASLRGSAGFSALAVGKFGLRALAHRHARGASL